MTARGILASAAWLGLGAISAAGAAEAPEASRTTVFVSDVHLGTGCAAGSCPAEEDARWPRAWAGFLSHIQAKYWDTVDLVILGDLLELWQDPEVDCTKNRGRDRACSRQEVQRVVAAVLAGHPKELAGLRRFLEPAGNRLYVVPGNHDAGLLLDDAWGLLEKELLTEETRGRVERRKCGQWRSADGRVIAEHGHQLGPDANRFSHWPELDLQGPNGHLERTWGEHFVRTIYNPVESSYEAIDNLIPMSDGLTLYAAARGGLETVEDVRRFLLFNIYQTSWRQKWDLGRGEEAGDWSAVEARENGYYLVAAALPPASPFRRSLLEGEGEPWESLREQLTHDVQEMPQEELFDLCDKAKLVADLPQVDQIASCTQLGGQLYGMLTGRRVLHEHLTSLKEDHPAVRHFIYGHTHEARLTYDLTLEKLGTTVSVTNTGAFQRLTSAEALDGNGLKDTVLALLEGREVDQPDLERVKLESLDPCYSYVVLPNGGQPKLWRWRMGEADPAGLPVDPCDDSCKPRPAECEVP